MENDREICTRDLIKSILLKWRWMIIWMIICVILLNGYNFIGTYKKAEAAKNIAANEVSEKEPDPITISKLEEKLSERERSEVKAAVMNYQNIYNSYMNASEYNENSIRMNLDPNAVPSIILTYYVNSNYEVTYPVIEKNDPTMDIITSYSKLLRENDMYNAIRDELGWEIDSAYLAEIVTPASEGNSLLNITILGESQEFCEQLAGYVKKKIELFTPEVQDVYGEFDIVLTNEMYGEQVYTSLLTEQQTRLTGINNLRIYLNNIGTNLNEEQKEYFYALLDGIVVQDEKDIEGDNVETSAMVIPNVEVINIKISLLGCVLGILIVCIYGFAAYLVSPVLHTSEEIRINYEISVLGEFEIQESKQTLFRKVDEFIISFFDKHVPNLTEEDQYEIICLNIYGALKNAGMKRIFIGGSYNDERIEHVKLNLQNMLKKNIEDVQIGKSMLSDIDSLRKFTNADAVILLETKEKSRFSDIEKEMELCKTTNVAVVGMIVL